MAHFVVLVHSRYAGALFAAVALSSCATIVGIEDVQVWGDAAVVGSDSASNADRPFDSTAEAQAPDARGTMGSDSSVDASLVSDARGTGTGGSSGSGGATGGMSGAAGTGGTDGTTAGTGGSDVATGGTSGTAGTGGTGGTTPASDTTEAGFDAGDASVRTDGDDAGADVRDAAAEVGTDGRADGGEAGADARADARADAGPSPIVINEIKSTGAGADFVEFYNNGNAAVSLTGWYFTDSDANNVYRFPNGTSIAAHAFLTVMGDGGDGGFGFGLSSGGDAVRLCDVNDANVDAYAFASGNVSRCPNGTGEFVAKTFSTNVTNLCD